MLNTVCYVQRAVSCTFNILFFCVEYFLSGGTPLRELEEKCEREREPHPHYTSSSFARTALIRAFRFATSQTVWHWMSSHSLESRHRESVVARA